MGIPIDPPPELDDYIFVVFSGVESCPFVGAPPPSGYYEMPPWMGAYKLVTPDHEIVINVGVFVAVLDRITSERMFRDVTIGGLPDNVPNELEAGDCGPVVMGHSGFAYVAGYDNSGAYTACRTYNLYDRPGTMYEVQHIEAVSQTFAIANSRDKTRFLVKMDSP